MTLIAEPKVYVLGYTPVVCCECGSRVLKGVCEFCKTDYSHSDIHDVPEGQLDQVVKSHSHGN